MNISTFFLKLYKISKSFFIDLKNAEADTWIEFRELFAPLLNDREREHLLIVELIEELKTEWRRFKGMKDKSQRMCFFLVVDEVALIENENEKFKLLSALKTGNFGSNDDCWTVKVITSIAPTAIFKEENHTKHSKVPSTEFIKKLVIRSEYVWFTISKLSNFQEFVNKLTQSELFQNKFTGLEERRLLEVVFNMSGGHFRTIEKYVVGLTKVTTLCAENFLQVIAIPFPSSEIVQTPNFWEWIAIVVLRMECNFFEVINGSNWKVLDFVHNGFLIPEKEITITDFLDQKQQRLFISTTGFLYSYANSLQVRSLNERFDAFHSMKTLLSLTTIHANTYNQPKSFEMFISSHFCLSLQLRSLLASEKLQKKEKLIVEQEVSSIGLLDLFLNVVEFSPQYDEQSKKEKLNEIRIKLVDDHKQPLLFRVDKEFQKRYLKERFEKEKPKDNVFYLSSHDQEAGIEGFISLNITNKLGKLDKLRICFQAKLNLDQSATRGIFSKNQIEKTIENTAKFMEKMNDVYKNENGLFSIVSFLNSCSLLSRKNG